MAFGDNDFPIGPGGKFPMPRHGNAGAQIATPMNAEGMYFRSPYAKLPTEEKDFASVANKAKLHLKFGESYDGIRSLRKMGRGFQLRERIRSLVENREGEKKYLENQNESELGAVMRIPYIPRRVMQAYKYAMTPSYTRSVSMWGWRPSSRFMR